MNPFYYEGFALQEHFTVESVNSKKSKNWWIIPIIAFVLQAPYGEKLSD
jgi:hypothetical protein